MKGFIPFCFLSLVSGRPDTSLTSYTPLASSVEQTYADERPLYTYSYSVKDDNDNNFGADESRDGEDTAGSYYVSLPDGRLQEVSYTVNGDGGYVVKVSYQ